jgi:hypothetical protein
MVPPWVGAELAREHELVIVGGVCERDDDVGALDTLHGRIGMVVCYDLEFPEWVRLPALCGADLLCAPVNWPRTAHPLHERPQEVVRVQASASVNHVFADRRPELYGRVVESGAVTSPAGAA